MPHRGKDAPPTGMAGKGFPLYGGGKGIQVKANMTQEKMALC